MGRHSEHHRTRPDRLRRGLLAGLAAAAALSACAPATGPNGASPASTGARPAPGPRIEPDAIVTARGRFEGRSARDADGHARVLRTGGVWVIELEPDFALSALEPGADPRVVLGAGGHDPRAVVGRLGATAGRHAYALPAGLDIGDYTEVWIWCMARGAPLALARLALT